MRKTYSPPVLVTYGTIEIATQSIDALDVAHSFVDKAIKFSLHSSLDGF